MKLKCLLFVALLATVAGAVELKNGAEFALNAAPEELTAHVQRGGSVRLLLEENGTTGYQWTATYASNECAVVIEHRGANAASDHCGAPGKAAFTVTKAAAVQSPSLVEFTYCRSWEKDAKPAKTVRLVLYTIPGETVDFRYPASRTLHMLKAECQNRGIELIDWHVHIRGGLTPEMAAERERASGIRQSAMENHGREWEIFDSARLAAFADRARAVKVGGHALPVGIQVNDRDWFRQIDAQTLAKFDYVLADTMIMGKLPNGRDRRLWLVNDLAEIGDPERWMDEYVEMNLQILGEPISILANPGYLPAPLDAMRDRLWTEARMRQVIGKAVERGIAIEIQAESPYPSPAFLRLAKAMGAKFSFGTNNYDAAPKDLSRWLEAIVWLDLHADDIWTPACLKRGSPRAKPLSVAVVDRCSPDPEALPVADDVWQALVTAGHRPFVLSNQLDRVALAAQLAKCDLVLFAGGEDVDPARYGETPSPHLGRVNRRRDQFEYQVLDEAVKFRKPLFGICRGSQLLNCYFGGSLIQDIPSEIGKSVVHSAPGGTVHPIKPIAGSRLATILGSDARLAVSWHHQAAERMAPGFRVAARAADGVVEAYESDAYPLAGVQFHPEVHNAQCPVGTLKAIFERLDELSLSGSPLGR